MDKKTTNKPTFLTTCIECGNCVRACPQEAIHYNGYWMEADEKCIGCGICESKCPVHAIAFT